MTDQSPSPPETAAFLDVPRRSRAREVWAGAFILLGMICTVAIILSMANPGALRGRYYVMTTVHDAQGLRKGDPVQMQGVKIGRVRDFVISGQGVDVTMEIEGEYAIPSDSRVGLQAGGLMFGMVAEVKPGRSHEVIRDGGRLPGSTGRGWLDAAAGTSARADSVLRHMEAILSQKELSGMGDGLADLWVLLDEAARLVTEQRAELSTLMSTVNHTAQGLDSLSSAGPEMARVIQRSDSILSIIESTSGDMARAMAAMASVMERLERGEGTLGRLATDTMLYVKLERAADAAAALAEDVKNNPKKYVNVSVF